MRSVAKALSPTASGRALSILRRTAYGSYEELLASEMVDAVYVPLPTGIRKAWLIRAAEAGKHVLSEKPVAASAAEVREILAACRQNGVQFMDGVMFMHSRRLGRIRDVLREGQSVGQIRRIASHFSFAASPEFFRGNIRAQSELEPLGCLGDLGWYSIRFTLCDARRQTADAGLRPPAPKRRRSGQSELRAQRVFGRDVLSPTVCRPASTAPSWRSSSSGPASAGPRVRSTCRTSCCPTTPLKPSFEISNPVYEVTGCDFRMQDKRQRVDRS